MSILSAVKTGVIQRPQRVAIYGVESVGKTTLAAQAPAPLILDVEDGSSHLDVPRLSVSKWEEIEAAIAELGKGGHGYKTLVVDSMDWAEKLSIESMLARDKKSSVEDYGYGKGFTMAAERISRFLASLDRLIERGMGVILIAHAKVTRHEPPDGLAPYDRFELKMTRQTSPLVKEWCDSLLFCNYKTRVVQTDSGKSKGIGGKERVIYTHRAAAYDAKCRVPGVPEEIPMAWEAVAEIIGKPVQTAAIMTVRMEKTKPESTPRWVPIITGVGNAEIVRFLVSKGMLQEGQSLADVSPENVKRITSNQQRFVNAVIAAGGAQ